LAKADDLFVKFWGVRGSFPRPSTNMSRYGGNTSCIEVRCGAHLLIFDAGTGLFELGEHLDQQGALDADLLFTHTHFDHVCGLPFFKPAFHAENRFHLWAGHLLPDHTLRTALADMMKAPLFPVPVDIFQADVCFHDFSAGETIEPRPGVVLKTAPLNHPNGATGYRIEYGGKSVCYVTDTEHVVGELDPSILQLIEKTDAFIYDATYTDAEFPDYMEWGHSTWQEGVRLADAGEVGTLILFHHAPDHDDNFMDAIQADAEAARPGTIVAREGMTLDP